MPDRGHTSAVVEMTISSPLSPVLFQRPGRSAKVRLLITAGRSGQPLEETMRTAYEMGADRPDCEQHLFGHDFETRHGFTFYTGPEIPRNTNGKHYIKVAECSSCGLHGAPGEQVCLCGKFMINHHTEVQG